MGSDPAWLCAARSHLGEEAVKGAMSNPYILGLYALCGHQEIKADEVAWCAAFVGGSLAEVGIKGTHSLAAASYESYGTPLDDPAVGAVAVLDHHVGFVDAFDDAHVWIVGGNQGHSEGRAAVTVAKYKRGSVLAYRWPVPLHSAATLDAAGSRTTAKGRADQVTGGVLGSLGLAALAQGGQTATEAAADAVVSISPDAALSLFEHAMKAAGSFVGLAASSPMAVVAMVAGAYLVASGSLLRLFRVQDANTGRSSATAKGGK